MTGANISFGLGIDLSESMIEYAVKTYKNEKLDFRKGDICDEWDNLRRSTGIQPGEVDIVTSIYCLHWVSDQEKAMRNIEKMLKPGN